MTSIVFQMPSKNPSAALRAPAAGRSASLRLPARDEPPPVDDHVVRPLTREEMVRGQRVYAAPALEPHGDAHGELGFAVRGLVRPSYIVSTDLLTRVSRGSDFATDTSVRKAGIDPASGHRHLEELSFEIVSTQTEKDITTRAEDLSARGVRRVFAVFVKRGAVAEWSPAQGKWQDLPQDTAIEDPCFVQPLPVRALLSAAENEEAVARALLAKKAPALEQAQQAARQEGVLEGLRRAIEGLCSVLGVELTGGQQADLAQRDAPGLEALLAALARDRRWPA